MQYVVAPCRSSIVPSFPRRRESILWLLACVVWYRSSPRPLCYIVLFPRARRSRRRGTSPRATFILPLPVVDVTCHNAVRRCPSPVENCPVIPAQAGIHPLASIACVVWYRSLPRPPCAMHCSFTACKAFSEAGDKPPRYEEFVTPHPKPLPQEREQPCRAGHPTALTLSRSPQLYGDDMPNCIGHLFSFTLCVYYAPASGLCLGERMVSGGDPLMEGEVEAVHAIGCRG